MLKGVHRVAIICSDYQKSKDFYIGKLGLRVLAENYRPERNTRCHLKCMFQSA
ncbi:MAG: hypothetical protein GY928_14025 [Colwellia sp.]|nr:hypothetical protein [Colwellia sp.]